MKICALLLPHGEPDIEGERIEGEIKEQGNFDFAIWHFSLKCFQVMRTVHPSSISLSNVSFCVPILGSKNVTCLSDGPALHGFQIRPLTYSFLRGLAAPVIWKVRVLCYELTDVTLAWEDGQWVEAHKIILAGCSPKKSTLTLMFELNGSYSYVQETETATANRSRFWLPKIRT